MVASDNLGPMFHGTNVKLKPGTIIAPAAQTGEFSTSGGEMAWAVDHLPTVQGIAERVTAQRAVFRKKAKDPNTTADEAERLKNVPKGKKPRVYQVEPVDPADLAPKSAKWRTNQEHWADEPMQYGSKSGFRVVKKVK